MLLVWDVVGYRIWEGEGQDLGVPVSRGGRKSLPRAGDLQWGEVRMSWTPSSTH